MVSPCIPQPHKRYTLLILYQQIYYTTSCDPPPQLFYSNDSSLSFLCMISGPECPSSRKLCLEYRRQQRPQSVWLGRQELVVPESLGLWVQPLGVTLVQLTVCVGFVVKWQYFCAQVVAVCGTATSNVRYAILFSFRCHLTLFLRGYSP